MDLDAIGGSLCANVTETATPSESSVEGEHGSDRGAADEDTLKTIRQAAFDEDTEAPLLTRKFREVAFPVDEDGKSERLRGQIAGAARRLSALIGEDGGPLPRKLAVRVEETWASC